MIGYVVEISTLHLRRHVRSWVDVLIHELLQVDFFIDPFCL